MQYLDSVSKTTEWSVHSQGKTISITVIQVYAPASNAEETQIELFYEDLQDISIHGVAKSWTRLSDWSDLTAFQTVFVEYEGYSTSSKVFLPTVADIMVIWIKFTRSCPFLVHWFLTCWYSLLPSPAWPCPHTLIHGLTVQVLCNIVLYSIRFYFHHQTHPKLASFPLWPSHFILSGAINNCPLLFPRRRPEDVFWSVGLIFLCQTFLLFVVSWGSRSKNTGVVGHSLLQ